MATTLKTALHQSINAVAASGASLNTIAGMAAFATLSAIPSLAAVCRRANPMMRVVNKHSHKPTDNDVYCGRGSALGNPCRVETELIRLCYELYKEKKELKRD